MRPAVLVMAKAPVPGQVKTRLGATIGDEDAAELAALSLLDTLDACELAFDERHLALAGDLSGAIRGAELFERMGMWTVHPQRGAGFADRLAHAHHDAASGGRAVVQIGMDTPHVTATDLTAVADAVEAGHDAVLGPAEDGGWWVLAVTSPSYTEGLRGVEMSTERTGDDTRTALEALGAKVGLGATMRDVDTSEDAELVAGLAPGTRFARRWHELSTMTVTVTS